MMVPGVVKKTNISHKGVNQLQRYYLRERYEADYSTSANKQILYVGGDAYSAPAVYINLGSSWALYYICRDYLGSITHLVNSSGNVTQENSYDAWRRLRNPATQVVYAPDEESALLLGRGYTGHEHLTDFGLINMNARLYDPAAGRFLSPDPFVQMPDFSQNFNRYSYAMNNPFAYVDEDGEFVLLAVGIAAGIGAVVNVATHWKDIKSVGGWKGFWKGAGYFAVGGVAGGAGATVGIAAAVGFGGMMGATAAGVASASMGVTAGAAIGAAGGATSGFILNTFNSLLEGERIGGALQSGFMGGLTGGLIGGLTGGIAGGVKALHNGRDFWTGKKIQVKNNISSFESTPKPNIQDNEISISDNTLDKFNKHAFSENRHVDLHLPNEEITLNVKDFVLQNQSQLRQGDNTFLMNINGIDKSIKVYLENTTIKSINLYPGISNRISTNPPIKMGNFHW